MNIWVKLCIGALTGLGAVWSLGGLKRQEEEAKLPKRGTMEYYKDFHGPLISDNGGPDATTYVPEEYKEYERKHQKEKKVLDDMKNVQNVFSRLRDLIDFIINISSGFVKLFNSNFPQPQYSPNYNPRLKPDGTLSTVVIY